MASPEGGIRPEIYALTDFWIRSIRDSDDKISISSSDHSDYDDVVNLFWDLYEPFRLVPQFDEDILESLAYHVLLGSEAWSFDNPLPEDCVKWCTDQRHYLSKPLSERPFNIERATQARAMLKFVDEFHDAEHIRFESISLSDSDCEQFVLDYLDWLYKHYKISYELDGENDDTFRLTAYLHIAAARAFRIERNQGRAEEVVDCLIEVERTVRRIEVGYGCIFPYGDEIYAPFHSIQAVAALAYVELSRNSVIDRDFVDALHYLAKAAEYYDFVVECNVEFTSDLDYMRFFCEDRFDIDLRLRHKLEASLTGLQVSSNEATNIFRSIKENPGEVASWSDIVHDCRILKYAKYVSGREEGVVEDIASERGDTVTWEGFWNAAQAWASAQLSPSEYRKMREDDEKHAAETRLKSYFFGSNWSSLPERARRGISSTLTFDLNSTERCETVKAIARRSACGHRGDVLSSRT